MPSSRPTFDTSKSLRVEAWPDALIDTLGHDPRSAYVERFWLGVLGPSTLWLIRRIVAELENTPEGFDLDLDETAGALGLRNNGGKHSAFARSLGRTCQFGLAKVADINVLAVRRRIPPLTQGQLRKLPLGVQLEHRALAERHVDRSRDEQIMSRAVNVALSLISNGDDRETARLQLERWDFESEVAASAASAAWTKHLEPSDR